MAAVLVQHLDPTHASMLTEILSRATAMPVVEVTDHMPVEANRVYVIPPGMTMGLAGGCCVCRRANTKSPHHSIDQFLQSLADDQGHRAMGVILSGSASDGTLGLEAIKAEGGITFAQEPTRAAPKHAPQRAGGAAGCVDSCWRDRDRSGNHPNQPAPYIAPSAAVRESCGRPAPEPCH